ncbi:hypothetical protein CYMTET_30909, partial [Cymbomonas tetramitiformis]
MPRMQPNPRPPRARLPALGSEEDELFLQGESAMPRFNSMGMRLMGSPSSSISDMSPREENDDAVPSLPPPSQVNLFAKRQVLGQVTPLTARLMSARVPESFEAVSYSLNAPAISDYVLPTRKPRTLLAPALLEGLRSQPNGASIQEMVHADAAQASTDQSPGRKGVSKSHAFRVSRPAAHTIDAEPPSSAWMGTRKLTSLAGTTMEFDTRPPPNICTGEDAAAYFLNSKQDGHHMFYLNYANPRPKKSTVPEHMGSHAPPRRGSDEDKSSSLFSGMKRNFAPYDLVLVPREQVHDEHFT